MDPFSFFRYSKPDNTLLDHHAYLVRTLSFSIHIGFFLLLAAVSTHSLLPAVLPPHYLDATISIGYHDIEEIPNLPKRYRVRYQHVGTAFLYSVEIEKFEENGKNLTKYVTKLVTNKHVYEAVSSGAAQANASLRLIEGFSNSNAPNAVARFVVVEKDGKRKVIESNIPINSPHWQIHPSLDLAMIGISGLQLDVVPTITDSQIFSQEESKRLKLNEGQAVFVLGFPGLIGEHRDYVIVRSGIIARIRDTIDNDLRYFLVDAFVFPGNSGGPVILKPDASTIEGTPSITQSKLLGVISQYIPYTDFAVSKQTGRTRVQFEENSGLAVAIPAWLLDQWVKDTLPAELKSKRSKK